MSKSGYQLTESDREKGRRRSGGFTTEQALEANDASWHAHRDSVLKQFPDYWAEFGDELPKHPGGEIKEELLDEK